MTEPNTTPVRRVLIVLQSVAVGGMERQSELLAREFASAGVRVAVVVPRAPAFDALAGRLDAVGAHALRLDTDARSGRWPQLRDLIRLMRFTRSWRPDVVHLHTGGPTGGLAVLVLARLFTRAAVVVTEHNVPFSEPGRRLRLAARAKDVFAHAVIALSARNAELRSTWLHEPRVFLGIPPGIATPHIDASLRREHRTRIRASLGIADDATVIVSVARLAADKGVGELLRAFAIVSRDTRCHLAIVGDGPLGAALRGLASDLGIDPVTHFVGERGDIAALLDASDIFALAAPRGSGSVALLEAMARGLPGVITFCGRGEFLVPGETGLCAPPADPAALAAALLQLVRDPQLRSRLGANAARRAHDAFRIERVAQDHLDVYDRARRGLIPDRLRASALG